MPRLLSLVVVPVVFLAACSSSEVSQQLSASPSGTPSTVAVGSSSPQQTPPPTPTPTPPPATLQPDSVAKVVTTDLVLRSAPGTAEDSEIYGTLDAPTLLFVVDGPVSASGYEWYQVHPIESLQALPSPYLPFGWVAAAERDGEPWIAPASMRCPQTPDLEDVSTLGGLRSLACYGDRPLMFAAKYRGPDAVIPSSTSPSWLASAGYRLSPLPCAFECPTSPPSPSPEPFLFVHRPGDFPDSFGHPTGAEVQVVGHFDDPAALTCIGGAWPGDTPPLPGELTVILCRAQFVVTRVTGITR